MCSKELEEQLRKAGWKKIENGHGNFYVYRPEKWEDEKIEKVETKKGKYSTRLTIIAYKNKARAFALMIYKKVAMIRRRNW